MSQPAQNQDFQPLPQYSQTQVSNDSWTNVTITRTDSDGTKTQVSFIAKK